MTQIIDKVTFLSPNGMFVRVIHEGDSFRIINIKYRPNGYELHCDVTMERLKNNQVANRPG